MWQRMQNRMMKKASRSTPGEILNTSLMYLTIRFFSLTIFSNRMSLFHGSRRCAYRVILTRR